MIKTLSLKSSTLETDCYRIPGAWECVIASTADNWSNPLAVVVSKKNIERFVRNLEFFCDNIEILEIPSLGILPYDRQSPSHQVIAQRIHVFNKISAQKKQIIILDEDTFFSRLPPKEEVVGHSFEITPNDVFLINELALNLSNLGYCRQRQVKEVGDFVVRGSIVDIFPFSSSEPVRLDYFGDNIESIRTFNPSNQRSTGTLERVLIDPVTEIRLSTDQIKRFQKNFRLSFEDKWSDCSILEQVQNLIRPSGMECYLPLFFERTDLICDYLPDNTTYLFDDSLADVESSFFLTVQERYHLLDQLEERPILEPTCLYAGFEEIKKISKRINCRFIGSSSKDISSNNLTSSVYKPNLPLPISIELDKTLPVLVNSSVKEFSKVLIVIPENKRDVGLAGVKKLDQNFIQLHKWSDFIKADGHRYFIFGSLGNGFYSIDHQFIVHVLKGRTKIENPKIKRNSRANSTKTFEEVINKLTSWEINSPVVHRHYGVGRFRGLTILTTDGIDNEYLEVRYADDDKLYIPVRNMSLIERYTGADPDNAPLHKLGSGQWDKVKKRAKQKANDAATEILEILARRAENKCKRYYAKDDAYTTFCQRFYFDETPDQKQAIDQVLNDLESTQPMDRLLCGDVGFGKTEVAMRAAFVVANSGDQVAFLAPTTILVQQHFETLADRFSDTPIRVSALSRSVEKKQISTTVSDIESGEADIVIGTHKLLAESIRFKRLGLLIIDEEHRFGVMQKEKIKKLRGDVNILAMTATPIPRTLHMSLSGMKDLSVMATPPDNRVPINTTVLEWSDEIIKEAVTREVARGGQVYFIHNEVKTIHQIKEKIKKILPAISIKIVHGQLEKNSINRVMMEFFRGDVDVLLATTIVESGIDNPRTNTIIINRSDKLGLAQLYQLRGRVGRSNRSAHAYMFIPNRKQLSVESLKRVEAIESLTELGMGFLLASNDLEIRGAGEVLGEDQSGEVHQMGFSMFNDLLIKTINTLKSADCLNDSFDKKEIEMNLKITALIPEKYLPDVHERLSLYKRLAATINDADIELIEEEITDRFGNYPQPVQNLIDLTKIKNRLTSLGVKKVEINNKSGWIQFEEDNLVSFDDMMELIKENTFYSLKDSQTLRVKKNLDSSQKVIDELNFLYDKLRATNGKS